MALAGYANRVETFVGNERRGTKMFKVGQKVVCVDDSPMRTDCVVGMPLRLVADRVYTVRSIQTEPHIEGYGVRLDEIVNPSMIWSDGEETEWSYDHRRFRSIVQVGSSLLREVVRL